MRKIIISASNQIENTREYIVEKNGLQFNVDILPFDAAVHTSVDNSYAFELEVYSMMQSLPLTILKESVRYPKIVKEFISLAKELVWLEEYTLPTLTPLEKEIALVLNEIISLIPKPHLKDGIEYVYNPLNLTLIEREYLIKHSILPLEISESKPKCIYGYYATNKRQEIESIAQNIVGLPQNESIEIYVPNMENSFPLIESVFQRYNLDVGSISYSSSLAYDMFITLYRYKQNPSIEKLREVFKMGIFSSENRVEVGEFLNTYTLTLEELKNEDIEENIKKPIEYLLASLDGISNDFQEKIKNIYSILQNKKNIDLSFIHKFLENNALIYNFETEELFLENLKSSPKINTGKIVVKEFKDAPLIYKDRRYVVDLSVANYPQINHNRGILDEDYRKKISGYPSLQERIQYQLGQKEEIFNRVDQLILSYHKTSYEGKGIDLAFDIKRLFPEKFQLWSLKEKLSTQSKPQSIPPEIAQKIFFKEGKIEASVSSLQLYIQDPITYFIRYGLGIYPPNEVEFGPLELGNLNHKIMELEDIDYELEGRFNISSYKKEMILKRNKSRMEKILEHNNNLIKFTHLKPIKNEYAFQNVELFPNFLLKGKIDRIDATDNYGVILDYKSSKKSLSSVNMQKGLDLQLITYVLIAEKMLGLSMIGGFYFPLSTSSKKVDYLSYNKSKGIVQNEVNPHEIWMQEMKLSGWFFENMPELFDNTLYYPSLFEKEGEVTFWGKPYSKEKVRNALADVYEKIYQLIHEGQLDPKKLELEYDNDLDLKQENK